MVGSDQTTRTGATNVDASDGRAEDSRGSSRRSFLELAGASAAALAGLGFATTDAAAQEGGPPNPDNWTLTFEDTFDGGLDTSTWDVGWGWGRVTDSSRTRIVDRNTYVDGGRLLLRGTHDGNTVLSGGVNTRDSVRFGPGSYVEARLRFPRRVGFHPAFWAKPASGAWPPEIDVMEFIQNGSGRDDTHTSRHFLHFTGSTRPGDRSTHQRLRRFYEPGGDLSQRFHVYAVEWQPDRITMYVDNREVQTWRNRTMLQSMRNGAPFYINLVQNINVDSGLNRYLGQADLSQQWGEVTEADFVRVWRQ
jgi:beta-glucanase (GH16 family)